jgi:hypothetical protein
LGGAALGHYLAIVQATLGYGIFLTNMPLALVKKHFPVVSCRGGALRKYWALKM